MKFTDPTGHGWFSKFIKKFIGTIITVALNILFPGAGTLWQLAFAAIGSAVSTAVNGGTFGNFANYYYKSLLFCFFSYLLSSSDE